MSTNVFPILPLVQVKKSAPPTYSTKDLVAVSGKRVSAAWRVTPIVLPKFQVKLRTWRYAPSPWAAYTEPDLFLAFFNTHKGKLDSFLVDNTTRLYYPAGAADATSLRVRFVSDVCPMVEEAPGLYSADVEWESVL
jgi:hypothetical protein